MPKPIRIKIEGMTVGGVDAPTVEDLLFQIQDFVSILHGVEDAIAGGESAEIVWRVTDTSKNSPITIEISPFAKNHAMNVDNRAQQVVAATADGFVSISRSAERPMFFSDRLVGKMENVFSRVSNGLSRTAIDLSAYQRGREVILDREVARAAQANFDIWKKPEAVVYRELGSVEGFISKVELDGYRRPIVWLRTRIDGRVVKCVSKFDALKRIGHYELTELIQGFRIQVFGTIHYKDLEKIGHVEVDDVHVFGPDAELPDIDMIVAPNFTGGVEASAYLKRIREDE